MSDLLDEADEAIGFNTLRQDMERGFEQVGHAFGELEERLDNIEAQLRRITPNGQDRP